MEIVDQRVAPGLAALYLAEMRDNPKLLVEFVDTLEPGIPKTKKWVVMVSTQFGCPVGCRMCDAGALGFAGNLTAEEIVDQVSYIFRANPRLDISIHPKIKIHFARMGEPSLNPNVLHAFRLLTKLFPFPGILPSFSTVAPESPAVRSFFEEMIRLKDEFYPGGRFQFQFSLHCADEAKRREIVPIKTWGLEEMASYGQRFVKPGGDRKITLNFALSGNETIDTEKVARIFSSDKFLIKITPINPTQTADKNGATHLWAQSAPDPIKECQARLEARGFQVILSPSFPEEVAAATSCGQLWSTRLKEQAVFLTKNYEREKNSYITVENLNAKAKMWMDEIQRWQRRSFSLNVEKAGLLVVDMQELFLNPRSPAYIPPARTILPNIQRLVEAFRKAGRPVCFSSHAHENPDKDGGLMTVWWKRVCLSGSQEAKITPVLEPTRSRCFGKCRYNAFTNPGLEESLRQDKVEEIVLCGVATHLCVESTARDAFDRAFQPFVVLDATAAHTEDLHLASIKNMSHGFACVLSTEQILSAIQPEKNIIGAAALPSGGQSQQGSPPYGGHVAKQGAP